MKKKIPFITLLLALMLVFSFSMAVSASPVPNTGETPVIALDTRGTPAADALESSGTDTPDIQGEATSGPEAPDGEEQAEDETESASSPQKSNNAPFFVGAGIAVLLFLGVALYCKANGKKSL